MPKRTSVTPQRWCKIYCYDDNNSDKVYIRLKNQKKGFITVGEGITRSENYVNIVVYTHKTHGDYVKMSNNRNGYIPMEGKGSCSCQDTYNADGPEVDEDIIAWHHNWVNSTPLPQVLGPVPITQVPITQDYINSLQIEFNKSLNNPTEDTPSYWRNGIVTLAGAAALYASTATLNGISTVAQAMGPAAMTNLGNVAQAMGPAAILG